MMIAVPVSGKWVEYFGGDIRVAQELQRDVFIVFAGFRIVKDIRHLLLMRRAKHKGGVVESMLRQKGQRLRVNFSTSAGEFGDGDVITAEEIILGVILLSGKGSW